MVPRPLEPQMTPVVRHRLKERFPNLTDEDLPVTEVGEAELIARLARCTGETPATVREILLAIGALIPVRVATGELHTMPPRKEESLGSGIPDDTGQSGTAGLGPAW